MVSWTCAGDALSARAISGSDGKYMSVESGAIAVNAASRAVSAKVPGRSIGGFPRVVPQRKPGDAECLAQGRARR